MNTHLLRHAVFGAIGALALSVAPVPEAGATTLAHLTVEQFTDASDYIIRGDVQEVWTELDAHGSVWTRARVTVTETLKGPDQPSDLVIDSLGGSHGAVELHVPSAAVFSEHESLFAFLNKSDSGRIVTVAMFMGKYTVRRAPGESRHHVLRWQHHGPIPFDARFLPHPPPEERVYLDDLVSQVQSRLDVGWDGKPIPGISNEKLLRVNTSDYRMPR